MNDQQLQAAKDCLFSSGTVEWYSPSWLLDKVRAVFGGYIDLDPASSDEAQKTVQALVHWTRSDADPLEREWFGNVFCNPPYGVQRGVSRAFLWGMKMIEEYRAGRVHQGILLLKGAWGYNWFECLIRQRPAITCMLKERVGFGRWTGEELEQPGRAKIATALLYVGRWDTLFKSEFGSMGMVVRWDNPLGV